jgi:hypothetical protein
MRLIRLKNPSGQKVTVKKTISDVSPGNSNRVRTKLARKNSRHFSCIFTHLQKQGVLQQNRDCIVLLPPGKGSTRRLEFKLSIGFVHPGGFMLGWFMGQMMEQGFRRLGCAN